MSCNRVAPPEGLPPRSTPHAGAHFSAGWGLATAIGFDFFTRSPSEIAIPLEPSPSSEGLPPALPAAKQHLFSTCICSVFLHLCKPRDSLPGAASLLCAGRVSASFSCLPLVSWIAENSSSYCLEITTTGVQRGFLVVRRQANLASVGCFQLQLSGEAPGELSSSELPSFELPLGSGCHSET